MPNPPRRRLPHVYAIGRPLFITFCLHNSLPPGRAYPAGDLTSGAAFANMDRLLDQAREGPTHLRIPEIAALVKQAILQGEAAVSYDFHAWVIMSNHVHLLITPQIDPPRLLQTLKGSTARAANLALHRQGTRFWQPESYDRLIRSPEEYRSILRYILQNPVKAALAPTPETYPWSSAYLPK